MMAEQIRYNEEHKRWAGTKVATLAKRILASEVGIAEGSGKLAKWRFDLGAEAGPDFIFFVGIESETDRLPLGPARRHWNPDILRVKEAEFATLRSKRGTLFSGTFRKGMVLESESYVND
jgi:hypothetical protein